MLLIYAERFIIGSFRDSTIFPDVCCNVKPTVASGGDIRQFLLIISSLQLTF